MTYLYLQINTGLPKLVCCKRQPVWQRRLRSTQSHVVMTMAERIQSFHNYGISKAGMRRKPEICGGRELWMSELQVISRLR